MLASIVVGCAQHSSAESREIARTVLDISAANAAQYRRTLDPGAYSVVVTEDGIDFRINVAVADKRGYYDDPAPRHGVQLAYLELTAPTEIAVEVVSSDHPTRTGRAELTILRWTRTKSEEITSHEQADREYSGALQQAEAGKATNWATAAAALERAAKLYRRAGDDGRASAAHLIAGQAQYRELAHWQAAVASADAALDAARRDRSPVAESRALTLRAAAHLEIAGEMDGDSSVGSASTRADLLRKADNELQTAAETFLAQRKFLDLAAAINFRGVGKWYARDFKGARAFFTEAAQRASQSQDAATEAAVRGNLAWIDVELGQAAEAASQYERLLKLINRDKQPNAYAAHVANYALALGALGEFDRALLQHTEVLDLATLRADEAMRGRQLVAIASLSLRAGDAERALDSARAALELPNVKQDAQQYFYALRLAGNAAAALGNEARATKYHSELLAGAQSPFDAARARILLASHYRKLRHLERAEAELLAALREQAPLIRAEALNERGLLNSSQAKYSLAIADFNQANTIFQRLNLDFPRIETLAALSHALLNAGRPEEAATAADAGIAIVSAIRVKSANPETRSRFVGSQYSPFEAKVLALLGRAPAPAPQQAWSSLIAADAVRAKTLAEMLLTRDSKSLTRNPEREALRDRMTLLQLRLEDALQQQSQSVVYVARLRRDLEEVRSRFDSLTRTELPSSTTDLPLPAMRADLQARIGTDTTLAYFFVGEEQSLLWLIAKDGIRVERLPPKKALAREVDTFVATLRAPAASLSKSDHSCCRTLTHIAELLVENDRPHLLVVPDGPLNNLPFAALPLNEPSKAALVETRTIAYASSLHAATLRARPDGRLVALVADPVYSIDDARLSTRVAAHGSSRPKSFRGARSLTRLPYSAAEVRAIEKHFDPEATVVLSGFSATRDKVANLPFADLRILHVAAHAIARADAPAMSALYLTAIDENGDSLPTARLTADEIRELGVRADLVVLSGCSTADGSSLQGEGVLGLTHSLLANDSRAVVASLWPVPDGSTARFMADFYDALQRTNAPREALAEAQRAARQQRQPAASWASFVVRTNSFFVVENEREEYEHDR